MFLSNDYYPNNSEDEVLLRKTYVFEFMVEDHAQETHKVDKCLEKNFQLERAIENTVASIMLLKARSLSFGIVTNQKF